MFTHSHKHIKHIFTILATILMLAGLMGVSSSSAQAKQDVSLPFQEGVKPSLSVQTPLASTKYLSAGWWHTCGVKNDGTIACWGAGTINTGIGPDYGQSIPPTGTFSQVTSGAFHTCGIKSDGSLACWGAWYGQPTPPTGTFIQVSAGNNHTCGLKSDGSLICWGDDYYGQIDAPSDTLTQVSAGVFYTCGIKTDGTIVCWGDNGVGQATPPAGIFTQVSSGNDHTCGLKSNGSLACWGYNAQGQSMPPAGTFTQVSSGGFHSCGLKSDGSVACWGAGTTNTGIGIEYGQSIPPAGTFTTVSAGYFHTCGLRTDGSVTCWGRDNHGQSTPPPGILFGPRTWTIMIYLDGDNNLDPNYFNVFNQLENVANNPNINIVVLWDRSGNNNSAYYKVKYDADLDKLAPYTEGVDHWSKGELNMGDPTSLSDFVQWARINYPAQHYALLISNHGTGLNGTALDQTGGNDWLTVNEMGNALSTATTNGSDKLDIVFADSCLMGMIEDGYQIRSYANIYIASENEIWITGSGSRPYSNYFSGITASTTPQSLASTIVAEYASWLDSTFPGKYGYTLSAVDLTKIDPLVNVVSNLGALLSPQIATYASQIQAARNATQKFDSDGNYVINTSDEYVDLANLASELKAIPDSGIQTAAQNVIDAVGTYVIANIAKMGSTYSGLDPNRIHGVSIFFPTGDMKRSFYNGLNLDFANGTTWFAQNMPILSQLQTLGWGPMLVNYVENITPAAPDNPNPPNLKSPMETGFRIYLPLILR